MAPLSLHPVLLDGLNRHLGSAVFDFRFRGKITATPVDTLADRVENAWERMVDIYHDHRAGGIEEPLIFGDPGRPGQEHVRYALSRTNPKHQDREAYPSERVVRAAFNVLAGRYLEYCAAVNNATRLRQNAAAVRSAFSQLDSKNPSVVRFDEEHPADGYVVVEIEDAAGHILRYSAGPLHDRMLFGIHGKGATVCDDLERAHTAYLHIQSIANMRSYQSFIEVLKLGQ